jgi:hypothetical protein
MVYIDKHPFKSKYELYENNVCILLMKNLRLNPSFTPYEAVEYFLGWFNDVKQPKENKVREAIIFSIHDGENEFNYSIKTVGESKSDNLYHSAVSCLVADSDGNDKMVTFFAKYSTEFSEVLIYPDELSELILKYSSDSEIERKNKDFVKSIPGIFINTVLQKKNFKLPINIVYKILQFEDIFFETLNCISTQLNTDLYDFQSVENYKLKYQVFNQTDHEINEKCSFRSEIINKKLIILSNLRSDYETAKYTI